MTTNPTPDPTAEIAELVPLMEAAGIMPERLRHRQPLVWGDRAYVAYMFTPPTLSPGDNTMDGSCPMHDSDLLHILRGTAEDWLRGRGWKPSKYWNRYNHPKIEGITDFVLPAALAAEIEKGVG